MTAEQVSYTISLVPSMTDDELIHNWKCCSSRQLASEKKLLAPLVKAIEAERKHRNKSKPQEPTDENPSQDTEI